MSSYQGPELTDLPAELNGHFEHENDEDAPMSAPQVQTNGESSNNGVHEADEVMVSYPDPE
jgi:hypothetical protein